MQTDPTLPEITARDLSYHEARAGIAARDAAADLGGSPAQVRALVAAASHVSPSPSLPVSQSPSLAGKPLRRDDLLVTLCLNLHAKAFGRDPRAMLAGDGTDRMQAIASLAFIFTDADRAFDLLDRAVDPDYAKEDQATARLSFRRKAIAFAAAFGPAEIETLTRYLVSLSRLNEPADDTAEDAPGEPEAGATP